MGDRDAPLGEGFATELAIASVDAALRHLQLRDVIAFTLPATSPPAG